MAETASLCDFGWSAPDFDLPGVDGKTHRLDIACGERGILVAFICNHCPYVKSVIGRLVRDANDLAELGVTTVAICSNDAAAYPDDSFENMKLFAEANRFSFPYLHDESQKTARLYGAVCTPDFFGFNADRELQYRGRLDASRREAGPVDLRRDLFEAMREVAETGRGPVEQVASIGCGIKWRELA